MAWTRLTNNTNAKANDVHNNLTLIRSSNLLPVKLSDTASYTTSVYNLGSTTYKWDGLYSQDLSQSGLWKLIEETETSGNLVTVDMNISDTYRILLIQSWYIDPKVTKMSIATLPTAVSYKINDLIFNTLTSTNIEVSMPFWGNLVFNNEVSSPSIVIIDILWKNKYLNASTYIINKGTNPSMTNTRIFKTIGIYDLSTDTAEFRFIPQGSTSSLILRQWKLT